jgi:UDP-N-acetylglucosamine 1-carboxyvinyltransferase
MTAALLTEEPLKLSNTPHLMDIATMANLLIQHGVDFKLDGTCQNSLKSYEGQVIILDAKNITNFEAPYSIVRKMRASVLVLGPLLARFGKARVSLPGGCAIGTRPIDLHLKALEQMGAKIDLEEGYISASVEGRLKGANIQFDKVSVGATENLLMAATLADGVTTLGNAAKEPEVTDLAHCLVKMGAKIEGIGTDTLVITGVESLHGTEYKVISDRIEAGTFMIAGAITNGDIELRGIELDIMRATIEKLEEAGVEITQTESGLRVRRKNGVINSVNATTQPYPGFATDMQAQFMALMCIGDSASVINETIFENRYMHVSELSRMGADITVEGHTAVIKGRPLKGAQIMATDLRASVSLVLAALVAEGETTISRMYHIDRGYERIEEKLAILGANIERYNS